MGQKIEKENKKSSVISRFLSFFQNIGLKIKNGFLKFINRFKDGSLGTKLSHIIMGAGNFYHKQYLKGAIYFIMQVAFLFLFISSPEVNSTPLGFKSIINFITLGTEEGDIFNPTDNSMLMLLFGVI